MKIAHVMMGLDEGGARTFMFDLACESARRGHDVHIVGYHQALVAEQARDLGMPFHCAVRGARTDLIGPTLRTKRLFERLGPDVVHTHTYFPHIVARPAARLAKVPVVVSSIQTNLVSGRGLSGGGGVSLRSLFVPRLVAVTDRFADRLFVVSRDIEEKYLQRGVPQQKIIYVPNGIRLEKFESPVDRDGIRREIGIKQEAFVVGTTCILIPRKRVDLIIGLAKTLASKVPRIEVLIIGDGSERSNLEALANDLGVAEKVHFTGARNDVHRLLPAMDVFVLASLMEGTSLAIMEAMASGRACVATAVGGTPQIISDGESGVLVSPGDGAALADAVGKLAADGQLRESLATKGRERVHRVFDVMKGIDVILESCEQLLAGRPIKKWR